LKLLFLCPNPEHTPNWRSLPRGIAESTAVTGAAGPHLAVSTLTHPVKVFLSGKVPLPDLSELR
jgi:hypothetical protein